MQALSTVQALSCPAPVGAPARHTAAARLALARRRHAAGAAARLTTVVAAVVVGYYEAKVLKYEATARAAGYVLGTAICTAPAGTVESLWFYKGVSSSPYTVHLRLGVSGPALRNYVASRVV